MSLPPGFTGSSLDRMDAARQDPAAFAALREHPRASLLSLIGLDPVIEEDALAWAPLTQAPDGLELALLGVIDGAPRFVALARGVSALHRSPALFDAITRLRADHAATYAAARSLVDWHSRHRFCANCGTETELLRAGWARVCPSCKAEHFPRTDPVVIMLAEHGSGDAARVLVGRQASWPPGRYSALAGFLEPGESIEEAVRRELLEESGIGTGTVRYVASQPWPFPSQLMIGCIATAENNAIRLDQNELEDAMWVDRREVAAALAGEDGAPFVPPPPYAIAHTLLERWAAGD